MSSHDEHEGPEGVGENEISKAILDAAFAVQTNLGPVYEVVLAHQLRKRTRGVERQKPMPIVYGGIRFHKAFRSNLVVDGKVLVEIKSVAALSPVHGKRLLTQLRLSVLKLGLLLNFGETHLKNGVKGGINGQLEEEDFEL